jgi:hypothetical protein
MIKWILDPKIDPQTSLQEENRELAVEARQAHPSVTR